MNSKYHFEPSDFDKYPEWVQEKILENEPEVSFVTGQSVFVFFGKDDSIGDIGIVVRKIERDSNVYYKVITNSWPAGITCLSEEMISMPRE